jgi:hypothetical protein
MAHKDAFTRDVFLRVREQERGLAPVRCSPYAPRWTYHLPPAPSWKTTVFSPVTSTTSK